jgi:tripartite-type tricarboxylate transporter receptor subunit TctC
MTKREYLFGAVVATFGIWTTACPTIAEVYPAHPITVVVPFAAGGPADVVARILSDRMSASLGRPLIVEDVPGAGGTIGTGRVARAALTVTCSRWESGAQRSDLCVIV